MTASPSPARRRLGFQFVTLARQWQRTMDQKLAEAGLTDATWRPLVHLSEAGDGIHQSELARRLGLDASTLVRLIDLLADRGLVERRVDRDDRRARRIVLTPTGKAEVSRLRTRIHAIEARLLADLDDATLETVSAAFTVIEARIAEGLAAEDPTP